MTKPDCTCPPTHGARAGPLSAWSETSSRPGSAARTSTASRTTRAGRRTRRSSARTRSRRSRTGFTRSGCKVGCERPTSCAAARRWRCPSPSGSTSSPSTSRRIGCFGRRPSACCWSPAEALHSPSSTRGTRPSRTPAAATRTSPRCWPTAPSLAYCTVAGLPLGHLVYAAGNEEPAHHVVRNSGITIEVHCLDLHRDPPELLDSVDKLARFLAGRALVTAWPAATKLLPVQTTSRGSDGVSDAADGRRRTGVRSRGRRFGVPRRRCGR